MAVEDDLGASDEIKEFKHEGEIDPSQDGLVDVKNALGLAADHPPLATALDYILQIKKGGISPLVIEVANRIKQEQLLKNNANLYNTNQNTMPTAPALYGGAAPKLSDQFPRICLPAHIPNVNAATLTASYPRSTWTTPMLITSSQSTLQHRPHQLPTAYYYNQSNLHYPQHFGQGAVGASQHLAAQQQAQQQQQQQQQQAASSKPTKGSKAKKKSDHIKKPLNAFMLYMKEMRAKVVQEYTLKESAAINQILGKRWHALDRSEQARFYEMARRERALHMQMYPNWSARSNYAATGKKKRKRDKAAEQDAGSPKKCRARYGLDKQSSWCKPCRRKKKCVRYLQGEDMDCKDGRCDADGENHKPSCPAAHEPGCSVRGSDCDCNTHTCGKKKEVEVNFASAAVKKEEKDCTCRKEDAGPAVKVEHKTPNVVVAGEKDTSLHLASVANLSLTRETGLTREPAPASRAAPAAYAAHDNRDNLFNTGQFRPGFDANQPRVFPLSQTQSMDYSIPPTSAVSVLSHYPTHNR